MEIGIIAQNAGIIKETIVRDMGVGLIGTGSRRDIKLFWVIIMKTILEAEGYNGGGWRVKLLTRKEAYKGIDRIRLEFFNISKKQKKVWYDLQPFEAANIAAGLSGAVFFYEIERLAHRRASRRKARKVVK